MIIKSLSRKSRNPRGSPGTFRARRGRGHTGNTGHGGAGQGNITSPFFTLATYMNREIEESDTRDEHARAVLWHNFYGDRSTSTEEIIDRFETNARLLRERKNGNVLYHEILSFERGYSLDEDALARIAADIGQEYLRQRAADQLAYGVLHLDTDHCHLHLMISANRVDSPERVRFSKAEFAEIQKAVERYTREHYPELKQRVIYDKDRGHDPNDPDRGPSGNGGNGSPSERVRLSNQEESMRVHRGVRSEKIELAQRMHQLFEQARSFEELTAALQAENIRLYQRGKTPGIVVMEPDGTERKHRLATLGLMPHYEATSARLVATRSDRAESLGQPEQSGFARENQEGTTSHDTAMPSRGSARRETPRENTDHAASPENQAVPPPPPSTQQTASRDRLNERETGAGQVNPKFEKAAQMAEDTSSKVRDIVDEELRFGKEVLKDFIFSPYRDDRQPGNAKPPPPSPKRTWTAEDRARARTRHAPSPAAEPRSVPRREKSEREQMMDELHAARQQGRGQEVSRDRENGDGIGSNEAASRGSSSPPGQDRSEGHDR